MRDSFHDELSFSLPPVTSFVLQVFGERGVLANLRTAVDSGAISFQLALQPPKVTEPPTVKFNRLLADWRQNTRYKSSFAKIVLDPAYQKIIAMGQSALPFILQELKTKGGHWFYALEIISDEHIGNPGDDFEAVRIAWLNWGREHGYLLD